MNEICDEDTLQPMTASYQEIAAYICREGSDRGYSVIPEVRLPTAEGRMHVDLVWAVRLPEPSQHPPDRVTGFLSRWQLIATFEIEGADVPLDRLETHLERAEALVNMDGSSPEKFVVLYTQHHGREGWGADTEADRIEHVDVRVRSAEDCEHIIVVCVGADLPARLAERL